jgi:PIN domain nuclease of toxin-antitoxin system
MRLLLDSHALIWWFTGDQRLSQPARDAITPGENDIFVSAASAWEIVTKHRLGKLKEVELLAREFLATIRSEGLTDLPISVSHGALAGNLPGIHKDPFDRMLIAQALTENLVLVSNEAAFDAFGVSRLW